MTKEHYFLLEDVGVKPTTSYKVKVRNQDEQIIFHEAVTKNEGKKKKLTVKKNIHNSNN